MPEERRVCVAACRDEHIFSSLYKTSYRQYVIIKHATPQRHNGALVRRWAFLPRDAMSSADYAIARCLSVCPFVRPTYAGILSKRLDISSNCFHQWVATLFSFFSTKPYVWQYSNGEPLTWASNGASSAKGVWKNRDFRPMSIVLSWKWYKIELGTMEDE